MTNWPTPYEYDQVILHQRRTAFSNPKIQNGQLAMDMQNPAHLNAGGSRHVCVYKVGDMVLRCFASDPSENIAPPADIIQRYQSITAYLQTPGNSLSFLVSNEWITSGIKVKGNSFPFLQLPYIDKSQTLGDFLSDHHNNRQAIQTLNKRWFDIIRQLENKKIAHGDLDASNILVSGPPSSPALHLVDFDGMYVPTFASKGMKPADNGHENFQPADTSIRIFGPEMDHFSALIICLSLCALEMNASLWRDCSGSDRSLLLGAFDFANLSFSKNFARLRRESSNSRLQRYLDELETSIQGKRMPRSLDDILQSYRIPDIDPPQPATAAIHTGLAMPRPIDGGTPLPVPPDISGSTGYVPPTPPRPINDDVAFPSSYASPSQNTFTSSYGIPTSGTSRQPTYRPPRRHTGRNILITVIILIVLVAIIVAFIVHNSATQHSTQINPGFVLISQLVFVLPLSGIGTQQETEAVQEKQPDEKT